MVRRKITNHLAVLQSRMKHDPEAYNDEFVTQFEHLKASMQIFTSHSPEWNDELAELLLFIAHVINKYKTYIIEYIALLESTIVLPSMGSSSMRNVLLNCLMLLRRKNGIEPDRMYKLLFSMVQRNEANKSLYKISRKFMIRDIQLLHSSAPTWDGKLTFEEAARMKEVVNVHIGQAGCQIGQAVWELYCVEHSLSPDGLPDPMCSIVDTSFRTHFYQSSSDKYVPRSIFVDTDPTVIDEIRTGTYCDWQTSIAYRSLFDSDFLISGNEDAASNYGRAYHNIGPPQLARTMEELRKISESVDQLQGFIVFHSLGGGTGSGFCSLLMESLSAYYNKITRAEIAIYPSPRLSPVIVEPYNSLLNTHVTLNCSHVVFLMDNEALCAGSKNN